MDAPRPPLAELSVCTPWYPTGYNRVAGSFVADWSALGRRLTPRVRVVHSEEWPGGTAENVARWRTDTDRVFASSARRGGLDVTGRWGLVTRVPTVITSGWDVPARAEAAVEAAGRLAPGLRSAPVVHGHVGYLGGLVGARLADPSARLVVTEHSTGLVDLLASPRGLELYDEVLTRAHRLTCVSSVVRRQVVEALSHHADKIVVVPNPVDFHPRWQRTAPPERLDRWVFGGGLIERKGVVRLVEAFGRFAHERREATLTLYGSGPLETELRDRAAAAGVGDRVRLLGNVGHAEFLAALPDYDVLLAPSTRETFHLVVPEAVAAGLPVVVTRSGGPEEALAGVVDRVGRFLDVADDPDGIVDAVRDLEAGLSTLDLPGARAELDARYGPDAVTRELAHLYGVAEEVSTAVTRTPISRRQRPVRVILISASGWRRYAVESEEASAHEAEIPTSVVTSDAGVREIVPRAIPVEPGAFLAAVQPVPTGAAPTTVARQAASGIRRVGRRLASLRGSTRDHPAAATAGSGLRDNGGNGDTDGEVHVLTHVSGSAWAAALLDARPEAKVVVELDRVALGQPPVDGP